MFAKVWPLALGPLLFVRRRWRGATAWVATGALGLLAWVAWAGISGIDQVVTFRGAKGWQIESIPGILLHMSDPAGSHVEQGAWRTAAAMPWWSRPLLTAATVGVVALAWWTAAAVGAARRDAALEGYAPLLAVLAMLVFSPIISPQYVLWFVPWAAIATVHGWDRGRHRPGRPMGRGAHAAHRRRHHLRAGDHPLPDPRRAVRDAAGAGSRRAARGAGGALPGAAGAGPRTGQSHPFRLK